MKRIGHFVFAIVYPRFSIIPALSLPKGILDDLSPPLRCAHRGAWCATSGKICPRNPPAMREWGRRDSSALARIGAARDVAGGLGRMKNRRNEPRRGECRDRHENPPPPHAAGSLCPVSIHTDSSDEIAAIRDAASPPVHFQIPGSGEFATSEALPEKRDQTNSSTTYTRKPCSFACLRHEFAIFNELDTLLRAAT